MRIHLAALAVSLTLHACTLSRLALPPTEPEDPLAVAVDAVSDRLFNEAQPALTAAIAELPPEAQALVQAAYVALQQAVDVAEARGVAALSEPAHADAVDALHTIAQLADVLHAAVHEPEARAPAADAPPALTMPLMVGP